MLTINFSSQSIGPVSHIDWKREGDHEQWHLTIEVQAATPDLLEQSLSELRGLIDTEGDLALLAGGDIMRQLDVAECRNGPRLARMDEIDSAPGDAHGLRKVRLHFEATLQDAGQAIQSHTATITVIRNAGAAEQLRTRGLIVLRRGEDPAAHEAAIAAAPGGFRRIATTITRDISEPSLAYELEDEQVFSPLPAGVDDGHYVISEARDAEGRATRTLAGFFIGAGALSQALALAPPGADRVIRQNPFTRRVDFEFREFVTDADGIAVSVESLSFTTTRKLIDHPLLAAGAPAYRQEIGAAQTEVVQQGRASGDARHVAPPPPRYAADLVARSVQYSVPHPALPADRRWVTTWRYVSRSRGALLPQLPESP